MLEAGGHVDVARRCVSDDDDDGDGVKISSML